MLECKVGTVVKALTDQLLDRSYESVEERKQGQERVITRPGLLFDIRTTISMYDNGNNCEASGQVFLILTGNTSVYAATRLNGSWSHIGDVPSTSWDNTSNHDSCWRDGVHRPLTELYFNLCELVNKQRDDMNLDRVAPINMSVHTGFGWLSQTLFSHVKVTDRSHPKEDYRRQLLELEILE